MAKTELTKQIEQAIYYNTIKMGVYGCFEVSIGWDCNERVDFMTLNTKGEFRCYEIKVSKADFRSSYRHSFVGHYNYYVMPEELYEQVKDEIPKGIGVYTFDGRFVSCAKKAKREERLAYGELQLSAFMIRALSREVEKQIKSNDPMIIEAKDREIRRLTEQCNQYRRECSALRTDLSVERRQQKYKYTVTDNANFIKQRIQQIAELGECEIADRWCDGCGECRESEGKNEQQ